MKKITLNKECFSKRNIYKQSTAEIEVPELNALMGLKKDQVAIVKIKQLDLDSFMKSRGEIIDHVKNLTDGIIEASADKNLVKDEITDIWKKMSPDTRYKIDIVTESLVEPKLNRSDVVFLSKMFPIVLLKIYNKVIELTNKGGDLKKNS